ncbi:phosphate ABC transporter permease subunit PstC [Halocatena halophila]|uniref:phosphate ABC transporter permease subunit PstC n=1 Tax=Halocatena halophila TaxID=2814576 RepID=UPI002ED0A517
MSSITSDLTTRTAKSPRERLARWFFFACAAISIVVTIGIVVVLVLGALKFFRSTGVALGMAPGDTVSLSSYLLEGKWTPGSEPQQFGLLAPLSATVMLMLGSAIIALPLGLAAAIYLSEYASDRMRSFLKPALEILAGVPTVVYGFFALVYITPLLDQLVPLGVGTFNMVSACIVVGIMIIPMVTSISEDAMNAVPDSLRQAGYGLGATKFDVSTTVVVPSAISGIASSYILALSRAIGETMAVAIAAGSQSTVMNPLNPVAYFSPNSPITAQMIQLATGDISAQGAAYHAMFALGLTLFVVTLAMNVVSELISSRYREVYR